MNQERETGKGTQSPGEEPVTLDRELPRMPSRSRTDEAAGEEEPGGPRMAATGEIGGKGQREAPSPEQEGGPEARKGEQEGGRRMDPHDESREQRADARAPRADQQPPEDEQTGEPPGDGYVRLRVVGSEGRWRVEGREEVPGPLTVPERLRHGWAWEVRCGGQRLGLGLVPDLGEVRGFPDPEGRRGMEGHHFAEPREVEFVVRIPAAAMRKHDVGELEIELYRVEDPPAEDVGPEPLGEQFPDRVARVSGRPKSR